jgi:hypothetical protein
MDAEGNGSNPGVQSGEGNGDGTFIRSDIGKKN